MTEQRAHDPLRTITDVMAICQDLTHQIAREEHDLLARMRDSAPTGFPTTSGGGGGGATNRVHNFGTDEHPDVALVPQHSDPTGEQVARDPLGNDDGQALRAAYQEALVALRHLEACKSRLAGTKRRERASEEQDRNNCWPCLAVGVRSEVYRDSSPNGEGVHQPRCRRHYDFFLTFARDAPREVAVWWGDGRRVTQQMIDEALGRYGARGRAGKNQRRKGKR
jgi:hypothetical protein